MFGILATGVALWAVYGFLKTDYVIIAANVTEPGAALRHPLFQAARRSNRTGLIFLGFCSLGASDVGGELIYSLLELLKAVLFGVSACRVEMMKEHAPIRSVVHLQSSMLPTRAVDCNARRAPIVRACDKIVKLAHIEAGTLTFVIYRSYHRLMSQGVGG